MTAVTTAAPQPVISSKPNAPRDWPIAKIIEQLSRELPPSMTETRKQGGKRITYIPWHTVNRILDKYAPGWTWEIANTIATPDRLVLTGRLTIPAAEGNVYREATGTEQLKEDKRIMVPNPDEPGQKIALRDDFDRPITEPGEIAYGDPSSNAESMAFRRCAARFGLGLYLYQK